ncbi:MAG: cation:proton antiporter [Magnetococcales bacterium]|nr:cation:proton antiporter [Magnetococcales bacterium]
MEPSAAIQIANHLLEGLGFMLAIGLAGIVLAKRTGIPDVAIFLVVGMLLGPQAAGRLAGDAASGGVIAQTFAHIAGLLAIPADSAINQGILTLGAAYILFDGGASLRLKVLSEVWISITVISTVGVLITAFVTAGAAYYILHVPFIVALLLGSTIASTDPATLVPVFRQVPIKDRVAQTVMSESAFNDAMGAIITFAILGVATGAGEFSLSHALFDLVKESFLGIATGLLLGYVAVNLIAHKQFGVLADFAPIVTLTGVIGSYMVAVAVGGSGFMAVFVFGIAIGNMDAFGLHVAHETGEKMENYVAITATIWRTFIFTLLGAQVDFALMNQYLGGGILVVLIFMLIARPLTVFLCVKPDRRANWSNNEMLFMCWTRETGVIPAALAGMMMGMKAPGAPIIASVTFIAVLMTILIQATTTAKVGDKLGLLIKK